MCNERCRPLVVGDAWVMEQAKTYPGIPALTIHPVRDVNEAWFTYGMVDVLDVGAAKAPMKPGEVSAEAGEAAFQYVVRGIELAMAGEIDATVTNASARKRSTPRGHHYSGHTEIYADYTHSPRYSMMLAHDDIRIVHVSTHVSLREACERVKKARVLEVIRIARQACIDMGIAQPTIAVAGLNPHSGENGLFGREEIEEIIPAIETAQCGGHSRGGPCAAGHPFFPKHAADGTDMVVAMYHDQGHIPLKVLGFEYDRDAKKWKAVSG